VFFHFLQQQHKIALEYNLDKHEYNRNELIEIRLPLHMPYYADQAGFERVNGAITVQGVPYKYVLRKVENGELVLLCLEDGQRTNIDHAKNEFGSFSAAQPVAGKQHSLMVKKSVSATEYEEAAGKQLSVLYFPFAPVHTRHEPALLSKGFWDFADKPPCTFLS